MTNPAVLTQEINHRIKSTSNSPIMSSALTYAMQYGFAVFPVNGKIPYKGTSGYKDASEDPQTIRDMFDEHPTANIGIATGRLSSVDIVDIDPRNGGVETWAELNQGYETCKVVTGSGGGHLYFAYTGTKWPRQLGPGVDMLSDGQCAIVPPSMHKCGKPYRWARGYHIRDMYPQAMPEWLLKLRDTTPKKAPGEQKHFEPLDDLSQMYLVDNLELSERSGRWWGLCPKHTERDPSFSVDFDKGVFFCHGCGYGGHVGQLAEDMRQ